MDLEDYEENNLKQTLFPAIYIDLIFPVKNQVFIKTDNIEINRPFISPILLQRKELIIGKGARIFGIRISPILACGILEAPLSSLEQSVNVLDDVCRQPILHELLSIIYSELDFFERLALIDCIFSEFNRGKEQDYKLLSRCINEVSLFSDCNVGKLSEATGYSARWLEKLILNNLGITPIQLISITRFDRFVGLLERNPQAKFASVAVDAGYYDQSHLIRDLKKFTANTPTDFKKTLLGKS